MTTAYIADAQPGFFARVVCPAGVEQAEQVLRDHAAMEALRREDVVSVEHRSGADGKWEAYCPDSSTNAIRDDPAEAILAATKEGE